MMLPLVVELKGRDRLEVTSLSPFKMKVIGCDSLFQKLNEMKTQFGSDAAKWPLLKTHDHASLLINELVLKLQNNWQHPYKEDEVCHCRNISLETVEQAITGTAVQLYFWPGKTS